MLEYPRGICWDLDHTLVGVHPDTERRATSDSSSDSLAPGATGATGMIVRPGIARTLARLGGRGYRHVVTTGGTRDYAERMLAAAGLRQHIVGIFEGAEIDVGAGKRYRPAAQSLGLSDEEARQHLLAIGDLVYDQPADIDGLVFIHQPNGFRSESSIVEGVIGWLEEAGNGDMLAGFHACHTLARPEAPWLPAGVALRLELRNPHQPRRLPRLEDIVIPTVRLLPQPIPAEPR